MWKQYKALVGLIILIVPAVAGAIWWFTPLSYAEETRQMVIQMKAQDELSMWYDRLFEVESQCVNFKTEKWLCSQDRHQKYEKVKVKIKVLEEQLGIKEE